MKSARNVIGKLNAFDAETDLSLGNSTLIKARTQIFHDSELAFAASQAPNSHQHIEPDSADYRSGVEAGRKQAEEAARNTITVMERSLDHLKSEFAARIDDVEASHRRVIRSCLMAILPEFAKIKAVDALTNVIADASREGLVGDIKVHVRSDEPVLTEALNGLGANFELVLDDLLDAGAISLRWCQGGVDINPDRVLQACLSLFDDTETLNTQKRTSHG